MPGKWLVNWGGRWGSNPRPPESQSGALPTELRPPRRSVLYFRKYESRLTSFVSIAPTQSCLSMARPAGLEPATLGLEGRCSIRLSYRRMRMVGVEGFEPPTSCSQSRRATRLRYTPNTSSNTKTSYFMHSSHLELNSGQRQPNEQAC